MTLLPMSCSSHSASSALRLGLYPAFRGTAGRRVSARQAIVIMACGLALWLACFLLHVMASLGTRPIRFATLAAMRGELLCADRRPLILLIWLPAEIRLRKIGGQV